MHLVARVAMFAVAALALPAQLASAAPRRAITTSPVETVFREWLGAFNSGESARIKAFYARRMGDPEPMFELENAENTCGFDPVRVESRTALSLSILLSERCFPAMQRLRIELNSATDPKPKLFELKSFAMSGQGAIEATASLADRLAARDKFAGSLIVAQGDKPVWSRSLGLVDKAGTVPITTDTPMFLASAGKMFTAVSVLQLVEAGKIELDAPFGKYLTDYPNPEMAKVTIRQLLNHRGGTGDIGILGREDGANRAKVRTIADILALNGARGPDFPPGSKEDYSNYGFILLGAVIERVTGKSYYDYVADHVFKPAGMTHAGFPDHDHLQGVAVGYTTFFGAEPTLRSNMDVLPWRGASAGGGVASANDMLAFFRAMQGGKLLSPTMIRLATARSDTAWYGMGFVVDPTHGQWGHGGNSYGMDVAFHHYSDNDTTFICLATRDMVCNRLIWAWYMRAFGLAR